MSTPVMVTIAVNGAPRRVAIPNLAVRPRFAGMANILGAQGNTTATYFLKTNDPSLTSAWTLVASASVIFTDNAGARTRTLSAVAAAAPDTDAQSIAFMSLIENEI